MFTHSDSKSNHSFLLEEPFRTDPITLITAMKTLLKYSIPTMATYLLQTAVDFINLFFVGRIGSANYTAALGLGILWVDVICVSILLGMSTFLETTGTQLFGSKDIHGLGVAHNKARVFITICVIPLALMLWMTDSILILVGMNKEVSNMAGQFTRALIPSCFLLVQIECTKKYLQVQTHFVEPMLINLIASIVHPVWYLLLENSYENKLIAIAQAKNITNAFTLLMLIAFISISGKFKDSWFLPNKETFIDTLKFFKLAIYGVIVTCLEWWAFEILCLFAGRLDNTLLAANVALVNINLLYYMFPLGIGLTTSTLIGNSLGELNKDDAVQYAKCSVILNTFIIGFTCLAMIIFGPFVAEFFSEDPQVQAIIVKLLPLLAFEEIIDTTQTIMGKILIGAGMQGKITGITCFSYYAVMVPTGYLLCNYAHLDICGLWIATCAAMLIMAVFEARIVTRIDWKQLVEQVKQTIRDGGCYAIEE